MEKIYTFDTPLSQLTVESPYTLILFWVCVAGAIVAILHALRKIERTKTVVTCFIIAALLATTAIFMDRDTTHLYPENTPIEKIVPGKPSLMQGGTQYGPPTRIRSTEKWYKENNIPMYEVCNPEKGNSATTIHGEKINPKKLLQCGGNYAGDLVTTATDKNGNSHTVTITSEIKNDGFYFHLSID